MSISDRSVVSASGTGQAPAIEGVESGIMKTAGNILKKLQISPISD